MNKWNLYINGFFDFKTKVVLVLFVFTILVLLFMNFKNTPPGMPEPEATESTDTIIPKGFVLVPLEIANSQTLAQLISEFGLVDLYSITKDSTKGRKVATKVKLIRAPMDPTQFAVLLPENLSSDFLTEPGPFIATIFNPAKNEELSSLNKVNKKFNRIDVIN